MYVCIYIYIYRHCARPYITRKPSKVTTCSHDMALLATRYSGGLLTIEVIRITLLPTVYIKRLFVC